METVKLSYQVMGIGNWTEVKVSADVARALVSEYEGYGWPVKITTGAELSVVNG